MKHLEDKRRCPACGCELHERPYLMARQATENVLSWRTVAVLVAFFAALALFSLVS